MMIMATELKEGKIAVIGGSVMTLGFRFTGIKRATTLYPSDTSEAIERSLAAAMADGSVSIVVIAESAMQKVKDRKLRHAAENNILPVVIAVPDYKEQRMEEDTLRALIKRAIGIDINAIHAKNAAK